MIERHYQHARSSGPLIVIALTEISKYLGFSTKLSATSYGQRQRLVLNPAIRQCLLELLDAGVGDSGSAEVQQFEVGQGGKASQCLEVLVRLGLRYCRRDKHQACPMAPASPEAGQKGKSE